MATGGPTNTSPPLKPPSNGKNDSLPEQFDSMANSELFSFMSFRMSDFSKIAAILKEREESAKAEALKDFSATFAELKDKNGSLNDAEIQKLIPETSKEIQLHNILNRENLKFEMKKKDCVRLEGELENMKKDCTALRESEKHAQEKINDLTEEVRRAREESATRRADDELNALKRKYLEILKMETDLKWRLSSYRNCCSGLKESFTSLKSAYSALEVSEENTNKRSKLLEDVQFKLGEERKGRIAEFDSWKDYYSPIDTWIQQFLDKNPHLVEEVKEQTTTKKQNAKFGSSSKMCSKRKFSVDTF